MHSIDIFRNGTLFQTVKPNDNSVQVKQVMGANEIRLSFNLAFYANFQINDDCLVFGEVYKMNTLPVIKKVSDRLYQYDVKMVSEVFDIAKVQFLLSPSLEADFSLMGNADTFMDLVITNINRVTQYAGGFQKGQVIPSSYKNITFKGTNCYNALGQIAEAFGTEFAVEGLPTPTIHLTKRSKDTGYIYKVGKNKGLYNITRTNLDSSSVVTRLYAFGSDKNLPAGYRASRLKMPSVDYLEKNVSKYGVIEATQIFEDVYPHRTGKVTAVDATNVFKFNDSTIDFDVNAQLLPGLTAKVTFNTGDLAGYTFEIASFSNTTKQFIILKNKDELTLDVPNSSIKPHIGDTYVLTDIAMPSTYVTAAENELMARAQAALDTNSEPQVKYSITYDPVYLRTRNIIPQIADLVWIVDTQLDIKRKIRITSTIRNIINEYDVDVELSDVLDQSKFTQIINATNAQGRDLSQVQQQIVVLSNNNFVGDIKLQQGTIIIEDLPTTTTASGFLPIYLEIATNRLFKKI